MNLACGHLQEEYWDKSIPQASRLAEFNETLNYKEYGDRWDYYDLSNIMYYVGFVLACRKWLSVSFLATLAC